VVISDQRTFSGFEAVLFDLDATLVDHVFASQSALSAALTATGVGADAGDSAGAFSLWSALEAEHFQSYLDGKISFLEQRRRRVRAFLKTFSISDMTDEAVDAWFKIYLLAYEASWRAFPDVKPCLDWLGSRASVVAVVTNGDAAQQQAKLNALSLGHLALFTSSQIGVSKPDPMIFRAACEAIKVQASRTIYVGDNAIVDAAGATTAGLLGVWLDRSRPRDLTAQPPRMATLLDLPHLLT